MRPEQPRLAHSLARKARAFALTINPPWWGRATLWILIGVLLLASGGSPSLPLPGTHAMFNFSFSKASDGTWTYNGPRTVGDLNYFGSYSYTRGWGWERWEKIVTGVSPGDRTAPVPPVGMTLDQV